MLNQLRFLRLNLSLKFANAFGSGSMSHGALSKEAHETLGIAMNRIGGAHHAAEKEESLLSDLSQERMVITQTQE